MKNLKTYPKAVAIFALAAILSLSVEETRAFSPLETHFLPAVQLVASQAAQVAVSNFSTASVSVTMNIVDALGNIVATKTVTVSGNKSSTLRFTNGNTAATYSAVVEASVANAIASDFEVLNSNGEVAAATLPFINTTPATQNTPGVRLIPGQSGAVTVTNITTSSTQFTVTVFDNSGATVLTQSGTLAAGQTQYIEIQNISFSNDGYRAVSSGSGTSKGKIASDLMTLDKTTGQITAVVLPPNPCS